MGMEGFFPKKREAVKAENKEGSVEISAKDLKVGDVIVSINGSKDASILKAVDDQQYHPLEFLGKAPGDNKNPAHISLDLRPVGKTTMFSTDFRPEDKIEVIRK